jgi:hypothetical protein
MARHQSILENIGRTPVVRINRLVPQDVNLWFLAGSAPKGSNILCMLPGKGGL